MSDTPRTDAALLEFRVGGARLVWTVTGGEFVAADIARELERDLSRAMKRNQENNIEINRLGIEIERLEDLLDDAGINSTSRPVVICQFRDGECPDPQKCLREGCWSEARGDTPA